MPKLGDRLRNLVARQVKRRGLVVWYDPERVYERFVADLELPDTEIIRFEDGFFRLRRALEPYLEFVSPEGRPRETCGVPPRVVVYVPLARGEAEHALVEAETAGTVLEPGAPDAERNTRLRVQAEAFFAELAPERASHVARQVDEGLLTLEDLDRLSEEVGGLASGALKLVFATSSPLEALLEFVGSDARDVIIAEKKALPELLDLARGELGLDVGPAESPAAARETLCRTLLLAEFTAALPEASRPPSLIGVELPETPARLDALRHLCTLWRNRADLADAYAEAARTVETEAGIAALDFPLEGLAGVETFRCVEVRRILAAEVALAEGEADGSQAPRGGATSEFWRRQEPALALRWRATELAGRVLDVVDTVRRELRRMDLSASGMVRAYTQFSTPWMAVDRMYRHWELRAAALDPEETGGAERFEVLAARVRREYAELLDEWARIFARKLEAAHFELPEWPEQARVFADRVAPALRARERVAYLLVDALRYEMAAELAEGLAGEAEVVVHPTVGSLPSITSVGMASLLPGAERGVECVGTKNKLTVTVGGRAVRNRQARLDRFAEEDGGTIASFKLAEILRLGAKRKKAVAGARLVVVTSQEIDRLGETGDDHHDVRRWMDDVLEQLRRGVRALLRSGVDRVIVTADHGHLFVDEIEPGLRVDAPGGDGVERHPRCWIGRGGAAHEATLRVAASQLGLGGDLEFVFPLGLGCFRMPGGLGGFLHGGISLQEMVIPVVEVRGRAAPIETGSAKVKLTFDRARITNRFFTMTALLEPAGLFGPEELQVRAEVLSGRIEAGQCAMAAYGFEEGTREIALRRDEPNALTFLLADEVATVTIRLLDSRTGLVLATVADVPVELTV